MRILTRSKHHIKNVVYLNNIEPFINNMEQIFQSSLGKLSPGLLFYTIYGTNTAHGVFHRVVERGSITRPHVELG